MENFTPISSLSGGLLIGLAAALLWVANGRIAGISGIVGNLPSCQHPRYRLARRLSCRADRSALVLRRTGRSAAHSPRCHCAGRHRRRIAGRVRHEARRWLHQWSRRLRPCSPLTPFDRRHLSVHGSRLHHGVRHAPCRRRLTVCRVSSAHWSRASCSASG